MRNAKRQKRANPEDAAGTYAGHTPLSSSNTSNDRDFHPGLASDKENRALHVPSVEATTGVENHVEIASSETSLPRPESARPYVDENPLQSLIREPLLHLASTQSIIEPFIQQPLLTIEAEQELQSTSNVMENDYNCLRDIDSLLPDAGEGLFSIIDDAIFSEMTFPLNSNSFDLSPQTSASESVLSDIQQFPMSKSHDTSERRILRTSKSHFNQPSQEQDREPVVSLDHSHEHHRNKRVTVDDAIKMLIVHDLISNYGAKEAEVQKLPTPRLLDNFVWKFFQRFHMHLPIFHVPTFNSATIPAPLLLAICSIGALYSLNRKHATILRAIASDALSNYRLQRSSAQAVSLEPLWQTQCQLLLIWGAIFGGSLGDASQGLAELGSFTRPYALRRANLSTVEKHDQVPTWSAWIDYEMEKRTLCGIYILSSLNASTHDVSPILSGSRDLDFELPAKDSLWSAATEVKWQELLSAQIHTRAPTITAVLNEILFGEEAETPNPYSKFISAFAATVIMHGVNVHMYFLGQTTSSLIEMNIGTNAGHALRLSHQMKIEGTLNRCQEFLRAWRVAHNDFQQTVQEESSIFNCQSLLRLSYVRIFSSTRQFNRFTLLYGDSSAITHAVNSYVAAPQARNTFLTKAAEQVMFCFTTPITAGHMLTRKTAALTWSMEHAVACWDCNLFLGKWIHVTELRESQEPLSMEESLIFETLKEALGEAENPFNEEMSLAAQVTRQWAMFMDDVWVWEVTLRMGAILRELADVYELVWQRRRYRDEGQRRQWNGLPS